MFLNKKKSSLLFSVITLGMLFLTASCAETAVYPVIDDESYQLQIFLSTNKNSRSFDLADGSEDEDFIGGITFALYYDGSFLMNLEDKIKETEKKNKYQVTISHLEFESAFSGIGKTFSSSLLSEQKFQILVTANWKSYDNKKVAFNDALSDLWKNSTDYNFTYKTDKANSAWLPNAKEEKGIPMFGLSEKRKIIGQEGNFDANMLRALAKIEVFDVMKVPDSDYPFSISEVTLSKCSGNGRLIPDAVENPKWNDKNTQVVTPSLPDDLISVENIILVSTTERMTYKEVENNYKKWICYVPEMDLKAAKFKDAILDITFNETVKHANVSLLDEINKIEEKDYILRNYLYRFFVTGLRNTDVRLKAIIDPDPYGDINFINIGGNRWWLHKETINDEDVEVWYKLVPNSSHEKEGRSHWKKQWYCSSQGIWYNWSNNDNLWKEQDKASQGPYEQLPVGINSDADLNDIITEFLDCENYDEVGEKAAELFAQYGKTLEIEGNFVKYFMLNQDVNVPEIGNQYQLALHRDYLWYGNGHTVKMKTYNNPQRYNIGPVRDIYIEEKNGDNRLYVDKEGWIWNKDGERMDQLTELVGNEKSYDLKINGELDKKSHFFSNNIQN